MADKRHEDAGAYQKGQDQECCELYGEYCYPCKDSGNSKQSLNAALDQKQQRKQQLPVAVIISLARFFCRISGQADR